MVIFISCVLLPLSHPKLPSSPCPCALGLGKGAPGQDTARSIHPRVLEVSPGALSPLPGRWKGQEGAGPSKA